MRSKIIASLIALGLTSAAVAPASACAFHDQQASTATSQLTAQAQPSQTSTQ